MDQNSAQPIINVEPTAAHRIGLLGLILALMVSLPPLVAALLLAIKVPLSPLTLLAIWACIAAWAWKSNHAGAPRILCAALAIVAVSLAASSRIFDLSFDGQVYHQVAVRQLAAGWNPVWNPQLAESLGGEWHVESLPKAAWLLEAMVFRATGSLESAKGMQLVALAAAFLLTWTALERYGIRRHAAVMVALLAAANPVALTQLFSFYVDGFVSSSLIAFLALTALWWKERAMHWQVGLVISAAFLANLKFPALMYLTLIGVAIMLAVAYRARSRLREAFTVGMATGVLVVAAGVNPYVTNTIVHGHPLYPAAGHGALPLVVYRDSGFVDDSRPVQLFRSIFSRSNDDDQLAPRLKIPFSVHASELAAFSTVDTRAGGWGPLFGGALLLALGILTAALRRPGNNSRALLIFSVLFLLSALSIPFGYYSRYAPQVWFACLPALLVDDLRSRSAKALAFILALNLAIIGTVSLGSQLFIEHVHRGQLRQLRRDANGNDVTYTFYDEPFTNVDLHMNAYGIPSQRTAQPTCKHPARLVATHALLCFSDGRSPSPEPVPRDEARRLLSAIGVH